MLSKQEGLTAESGRHRGVFQAKGLLRGNHRGLSKWFSGWTLDAKGGFSKDELESSWRAASRDEDPCDLLRNLSERKRGAIEAQT